MKRSSAENGAGMPTSSMPPKVPRLRRVALESDPTAGVATASISTSSSPASSSSCPTPTPSTSSDGLPSGSTGSEARPKSADKCQKVMQAKPHIVKRGLKRAGPYLLGKAN